MRNLRQPHETTYVVYSQAIEWLVGQGGLKVVQVNSEHVFQGMVGWQR